MTTFIQIVQVLTPLIVATVGLYLGAKVRDVHVIVNAQRTVMSNRIAQLEETIVGSNKEIPPTTRETERAPS